MRRKARKPGPYTIEVTAFLCRCGHEWLPKTPYQAEPPRVCPKCKSANWDRPYKFRRIGRGQIH